MRLHPLLIVALFATPAAAQTAGATGGPAPSGATVSGVVRDSLAGTPLAAAMVQLVGAGGATRFGESAVTDSLGRYLIAGVPDGRYTLGFFHPMLDSLGVASPLRGVVVEGGRPARADLAIPSPARLRAAICGARRAADSAGVVVGVVREVRDGSPATGVRVTAEWLELSFTAAGLVRRAPRLIATTGENGWFAICNVPTGGVMTLVAGRGADSTDVVELRVPAEGFARRELYLGPAQVAVAPDSARPADIPAAPSRRLLRGDGRVSGTVVAAAGGRPLANALVSLSDGPRTRANDRGEWSLVNAPAGTRVLEVRAVGYYPERRPVHVVAGAPPVHVALSTLKAVLDTVRVSGKRFERGRSGFQQRRTAGGAGRFITDEQIARQAVAVTSDIFRNAAGVRLEVGPDGFQKQLLVRGAFGWCQPGVYLDGQFLRNMNAEDIDGWVTPERIAGIEIYSDGHAPPQFQEALHGCGSVVIWTK